MMTVLFSYNRNCYHSALKSTKGLIIKQYIIVTAMKFDQLSTGDRLLTY